MSDNPTPLDVSQAASLMGRKGKGIRKTLTPEQREAKRERMKAINAKRGKITSDSIELSAPLEAAVSTRKTTS